MTGPWQFMRDLFGPPNIKWCEERLAALIEEPANTWSNLAYIVVGVWLLYAPSRGAVSELWERRSRLFGWAVILMGGFSLVYHATNNYATQVFDFVGMFLYLGVLVTWNIERIVRVRGVRRSPAWWVGVYFLWVNANMLLLIAFPMAGLPIQQIVMVNTAAVFATEVTIVLMTRETHGYLVYAGALAFMAAASAASWADHKRVWCDPKDHLLQGHAVWHVLSALSIPFVHRFYSRRVT